MSLTVSVAESFERHAGKQGVACSIPGVGIYFHFEFFAYFPLLTARQRDIFNLKKMAAVYLTTG